MPKKPHAADLAAQAEIASATEFSVFRRLSIADKICERGIPSLEAAVIRAEQIEAAYPGKPCMIYAIIGDHDQPISHERRAAVSAQIRERK